MMNRQKIATCCYVVLVTLLICSAPATAQGTLFVDGDRVGIGVDTPAETLHLLGEGDTQFLVEDSSAAAASRVLLKLVNNGKLRFLLTNTDKDVSWTFDNGGSFTISVVGTGVNEFKLTETGNLTIKGNLTEGSSILRKEGLLAIDAAAVLDRVLALPLREWSYKEQSARHLGPMAEDFHAAFGLGESPSGISTLDTSGVALAAIQGLNGRLEEKNDKISQLEDEVAELRGQLESVLELLQQK